MNITTKYHGEQEIKQDDILTFESGIPGFIEEKGFCVLPLEDSPFYVLQSINSANTAFIMADPFTFFKEYEFDLADEVMENLKIQSNEHVAVFVILTIKEPFNKTTANLQAPIIINTKSQLGKQYIINRGAYTTRHKIICSSERINEVGL
ncbi:flagellar assembly factor FliW [Bacillus sp. OV322]|uniref:flagellar assembly protein FliW n=1 Tax=Bacillus sp. OV322 TaxID=1882764 RepID=UPI0008E08EBC|nr:flagellar assembly protein FliW [Bacillus sp. OV322]SFC24061.1 flagellar assembly factor FliW [Bacillus sp. OV322]